MSAVEPCEHVIRLLRAVQDGKAACQRCGIFAEKIAGRLTIVDPANRPQPAEAPRPAATKPLTHKLSEQMWPEPP